MKKQMKWNSSQGVVTLTAAAGLMLAASLITVFAAKSGIMEQIVYSNSYRANQAFEIADAGMQYGAAYLERNYPTITVDGDNDGYIDVASGVFLANTLIGNGSGAFDISYSNPVVSDDAIIEIIGQGFSDGGATTRKISQLVEYRSALINVPEMPLMVKGDVDMTGTADIINLETDSTIWLGGSLDINGSAETTTSSGGSDKNNINSDIAGNDAALATATNEQFFENTFGMSKSNLRKFANIIGASNLNGKTNVMIWIDNPGSTTTINGSTTIGSATEPVVLIVNGSLKLNGNATIYGFVYVVEDFTGMGTADIYGGLAVEQNLDIKGTFSVAYDSAILNATQQKVGQVAMVPGGWSDFK